MKTKRIISLLLTLCLMLTFLATAAAAGETDAVPAQKTGAETDAATLSISPERHIPEERTVSAVSPETSTVNLYDYRGDLCKTGELSVGDTFIINDDADGEVVESDGEAALNGPVKYVYYTVDEAGTLTQHTGKCGDWTAVTSDNASWTDGWYVATGEVTYGGRVHVSGDVHLILCDNAVLTARDGITVETGNSLTIYAQSEGAGAGKLNAGVYEDFYDDLINPDRRNGSAGIGGGEGCNAGSITDNTACGKGGGIYNSAEAVLNISGNTNITGNEGEQKAENVWLPNNKQMGGNVRYVTGDGDYAESALVVPSGRTVTLNLNGKTINRGLNTQEKEGFVILVNGCLTVRDASATENKPEGTGIIAGGNNNDVDGGVIVGNHATFILESGTIYDNKSQHQGEGVYVSINATFYMTGGCIFYNEASTGGGVAVMSSSFTMSGGRIQNSGTAGGVSFNDGAVDTKLTVLAEIVPPPTGDNSLRGLWIGLIILSVFGTAATLVIGKKKRFF